MDAVSVETFRCRLGKLLEFFEGEAGGDDVGGGDGFGFVEAPDVEFVDGCNAVDLCIVSQAQSAYGLMSEGKERRCRTFSRSFRTSPGATPRGTD